jgi:hypothetical protein
MYKIKAAELVASYLRITKDLKMAKQCAKACCDAIIADYQDDSFVSSLNKLKIHEWTNVKRNI